MDLFSNTQEEFQEDEKALQDIINTLEIVMKRIDVTLIGIPGAELSLEVIEFSKQIKSVFEKLLNLLGDHRKKTQKGLDRDRPGMKL